MTGIDTTIAAAYRSGVVAPDVLAPPGTVTCTVQAGGACTANTYFIKVVAGNGLGRTTPTAGNTSVVTATTNLTVRAAFAAVAGAAYYDIYCSIDADPKWVGRITEAQRASGILITAVGVTGAGGTAGAVDVQVPGTGLQSATTCAVNTAYVIPANPVVATNYQYVHFDCALTRTGDAVAPACVVVPYMQNTLDSAWYAGTPITLSFGGTTGQFGALQQRITADVRGVAAAALVVQQLAGTGVSLTITTSRS